MADFQLAHNVTVLTDFADGYTLYDARYSLASHSHAFSDHDDLTGLADDDHTQYALLAGRSGGQVVKGGTGSGDDLTLQSTNHATKGTIFFGAAGTSIYDEVNERWGFGVASFSASEKVKAAGTFLSEASAAGFLARYTGASSSSAGPQYASVTNDGSAMSSQDRLGTFLFQGYDGSAEATAAAIIAQANQNWSGSAHPTKITFWTTTNSSTSMVVGMTVEHDGSLLVTNNCNIGGTYRVDSTQVVGNRETGWTAMTGTPNKATSYDTATVTLAQLAGRVASLQAALTTHGLIGA